MGDLSLSHMSGLQFAQSSPNVPPAATAAEDYGQEEFASISDYAPAVKAPRSSYGSEKSKRSHSNEVSEDLEVASYVLGQTSRRDNASEYISSYGGSRSDHESPTPLSLYDAQLSQISSQFGFGRHGIDKISTEDSLMNLDESSINIEALTSMETNKVRDTLMDYTFALDEREKTATEHMKSELRAAKLNAKAQVVVSRDSEERRRIADEYKQLESSLRVKLTVEKVEIKRLRTKALELIKQHEGVNRDTSPIRSSTDPSTVALQEKPVPTRLKDSQIHVKPLPSVTSLFLSVPEDLGTGASHGSISENIEFVNDDSDLRSVASDPVSIILPHDNSAHSRIPSQSPSTQPSTPKASTSRASASASTVTSIVQKLHQVSAHVADVAKLERKKERLEKSQAVGERLLNDSLKKIKLEEDVFILETRLQSILQQCSELAKKEDVLKKKKQAAVALAYNRASPNDLARESGDRTPTVPFRKPKNQSIQKQAEVSPDTGDEIDEDLNFDETSVHDSIPIDIQTDLASRQESIRSLADSILYEVDIVREKVGSSGFDKSVPELVESIQSDIKSVVEDISSYGESSSGSGASKQSVSFAKEVVVADSTSVGYDYESDAFEAPVEVATKVIDAMDEDEDSESDANDEDVEHLKNLQRELEERQAKIKDLLIRKKEAKKVAKAEQARLKKEAIQFEIQQLDAVIRKTQEDIEKTIAPISKAVTSPSAKKSSLVTPAHLVAKDQITSSFAQTTNSHLKSPLLSKNLRNDDISSYGSIVVPVTQQSPPSSDDISSFAGKSDSHPSSDGKSSSRNDRGDSSKRAAEIIPKDPTGSSDPSSVDEILSFNKSAPRSLTSEHSRALSGGATAASKQASVVDDVSSYGDSSSRSVDALQSQFNHLASAEKVANDIASQEYEEDFTSADDVKNHGLLENASLNEGPQVILQNVVKADMDSASDIAEDIEYDDHDFVEENDDLLEANSHSEVITSALVEGIAVSPKLYLPPPAEAQNLKFPIAIEADAASVVDEDLEYADDYADEDEESELAAYEPERTDLENSAGSRNIKSERDTDSRLVLSDEMIPSPQSDEVGNIELANMTNPKPAVVFDDVVEVIEEEFSLHSNKSSAVSESMSGNLEEKSSSAVEAGKQRGDLGTVGNTEVDDYSSEGRNSLQALHRNETSSSKSDYLSDHNNRTVSESTASEDDESELLKVEDQNVESMQDSLAHPSTNVAKAVPVLQHSLYADRVTELLLEDALRDSIEAVTMIQKSIPEGTPSPSLSESSSSSSPQIASISQPPEVPEIDVVAERSRRADEITNLLWMDMMNEFAVEEVAVLSRKETPVMQTDVGLEETLEGEFESASLEALIQARNVPFTAMEVSEEEAKQLDALIAAKAAADVVEISATPYDEAVDQSIIEPEPATPNIADIVMRIKKDAHYMSSSFGSQFAHAVVSEFPAPESPSGYERIPQIPAEVRQALVGFPMDPVIRARYRLLLDLIREALEEVFEHHESFASDQPHRATRSFIMLMPPRPISKKDTAARVAEKVGAWNAYTEVHGGNLDQMLMDSVKADEPDWLDMSIDREIVVNLVAEGLFGDISKDALSILSK
ncbi:hypothetical protein HDU81_005557 [Chytriomyces hyalinus]|nr:hypothetical protein HDU81_005557 [Chytriomyces hyalinus]